MKYCLDSRCADNYLEKIASIKVQWRDKASIHKLTTNFPEAEIVLQFLPEQIFADSKGIDWEEIERYNIMTNEKLVCALHDPSLFIECRRRGLKFYYGFPVDSLWELKGLKDAGVCYARLGPDLFFNMDKVKKIGVPIRAVPNVAYNDNFYHENGINGQWIRSEDVDLYKNYIDVLEFENVTPRQEEAFYRVYGMRQYWTGNLNPLITNLNYDATSRLIPQSITECRLNCGHKCVYGGTCQLCFRAFALAQPEKIREYVESTGKD